MMTQQWHKAGLLNRVSKSYSAFNEEIIFFNNQYKLIIKPDNAASSRGITILEKNSGLASIENAYCKALEESENNIVVVEEFLDGIEYTVDMIGDSFGNVCVYGISKKCHTKNININKIAIKLHYNSENYQKMQKIAYYGIECYKSLGFSSSLGHLELILKNDGTFSPIEIGARSSGFIASHLVDIVSGSSYLEDLIRVQSGAKVTTGLHKQTDRSSMYFFYDFPDNAVFNKAFYLTDFLDKRIRSLYHDRKNIIKGHIFSTINNDNDRYGFEILEGPKSLMTEDYIAKKEQEMLDLVLS